MNKENGVIDYTKPSAERRFYLIIENQKIFVDEQTYKDYMRSIWRDKKNDANRNRCLVAGKNGKAVMCKKDCKTCPFFKNDREVSLDYLSDECGFDAADGELNELERRVNESKYEPLYKALDTLPERQKEIILLHVIYEMTYAQIGEKLSLTDEAVRKLYTRGLEKIRKLINLKDFL